LRVVRMVNQQLETSIATCVNAETGRHVVSLELMAATSAEEIGRPDGPEAVSAARRELIVALRAEVEVTLDMGSAGGANGDEGGAEKEIEDSAYPTRHHEADDHPEARAHGSSRGIFTDVAHHQDVKGGEESPRDVEIGTEAQRNLMVLSSGEDYPEVVFDEDKDSDGTDNGPDRHQPCVFVRVDQFRFAHGLELQQPHCRRILNGRTHWG
jgi:hypothetical protein